MADSMDLVQARVEEELQRNLAKARNQPVGAGEFFCLACDEAIPEARRRAVQGCYSLRRLSRNRRAEKRPL